MIDGHVNGARYHLFLGERDFATSGRGVVWRSSLACLTLRPVLYRADPGERLDPAARRGAARDRFGTWYAITADRRAITALGPDETVPTPFWPPDDGDAEPGDVGARGVFAPLPTPAPLPPELAGLAITARHYLVAGTREPDGLMVFDLHGGGPPIRLPWPVPIAPRSLAPRPDGGLWVLEGPPGEPARLWRLDRYLRVLGPRPSPGPAAPPAAFHPPEGPGAPTAGWTFHAITPDLAVPVTGPGADAVVEALPDDTLLVLEMAPDGGASTLTRWAARGRIGERIALDELVREALASGSEGEPPPWAGAHDMAFVAEDGAAGPAVTGTLFVAGRDGDQAFAFDLRAEGEELRVGIRAGYFPLRRWGGRALVSAGGRAHYDLGDRWQPVAEQPRPHFVAEGELTTRVLDGKTPGCVWHRLFLDACIPAGTAVEVESRAADEEGLLGSVPWRAEPAPYLRGSGSELPYHQPVSGPSRPQEGVGTWELLFQQARGRYLQLRLTVRGTGRASPRLHAMRVHYPRFSYVDRHLPEVYARAPTASFLDRYLANVEGVFTEMEEGIAQAQALFDVRTVPADYLPWLAEWVGARFRPGWDEARRRLFLRHAMTLFSQRGTVAGLQRILRLTLDPCPGDGLFQEAGPRSREPGTDDVWNVRIVESFATRRSAGVVVGGGVPPGREPGLRPGSRPWSPDLGPLPLHERYRSFLRARHRTRAALRAAWGDPELTLEAVRLSPVPPAHPGRRADWRAFVDDGLGFTYARVTPADVTRYRTFLRRRYARIGALNEAHGAEWDDFDAVTLPAENDFPSGLRLRDWIQFTSVFLPIHRDGHRFLVLVPTRPEDSSEEQSRRMGLVREIVDRERPAHTRFDVQPYWAMYRVGSARLGVDTLLGEGSRFAALLLGRGSVAHGYAAPAHPMDVPDRIVTGRDRIPPPRL